MLAFHSCTTRNMAALIITTTHKSPHHGGFQPLPMPMPTAQMLQTVPLHPPCKPPASSNSTFAHAVREKHEITQMSHRAMLSDRGTPAPHPATRATAKTHCMRQQLFGPTTLTCCLPGRALSTSGQRGGCHTLNPHKHSNGQCIERVLRAAAIVSPFKKLQLLPPAYKTVKNKILPHLSAIAYPQCTCSSSNVQGRI